MVLVFLVDLYLKLCSDCLLTLLRDGIGGTVPVIVYLHDLDCWALY